MSSKKRKIRVGILFGGKSVEHEVSIASAKNVYEALDKNKYEIDLIGISKEGLWHRFLPSHLVSLPQRDIDHLLSSIGKIIKRDSKHFYPSGPLDKIDVIFPVLHGAQGEDGIIQGFLKLLNIPFVGAGVLGSAIGMDKDVMKRLLRDAGLPIAKFLVFQKNEKVEFEKVVKQLGFPFFVKPANLGSSVGVSKVHKKNEFSKAIDDALQYDKKILIEEYIKGREIECSVLGNENPIASIAGEIIPQHEFYDYHAKYIDEKGALLKIPADIPKEVLEQIQSFAIRAFKILCCEGMARVDFFLTKKCKICINELNTIPGFTKISMYPKLWEASGISYAKLIDKLITLALERFDKEQKFKTSI